MYLVQLMLKSVTWSERTCIKFYPLNVLQVSITQNSSFSTVVFQNSKLFDSGNRRTELLTSRVFSVKLHGEEKKVKKGFNIDLTMRVPVEGVAECRWYDTGRVGLSA